MRRCRTQGHGWIMSLPAGTPPPPHDEFSDAGWSIHAVDGDRSSLCDGVAAGGLVTVDGYMWSDIPRDQRCPNCQVTMTAYGLDHL